MNFFFDLILRLYLKSISSVKDTQVWDVSVFVVKVFVVDEDIKIVLPNAWSLTDKEYTYWTCFSSVDELHRLFEVRWIVDTLTSKLIKQNVEFLFDFYIF